MIVILLGQIDLFGALHGRRRHPHHPAAIDPVGREDAGRRAADHLRPRHHRHAVALWPRERDAIARRPRGGGLGWVREAGGIAAARWGFSTEVRRDPLTAARPLRR